MKSKRLVIVLAMLMITAMACQVGTLTLPSNAPSAPNQPPISVQAPDLAAQQDALVALHQQVAAGVVAIKVTTAQGDDLGSGFVYDTEGHIVTNYHVVDGATNNQVEVDFLSGYKAFGTVIGTDLDSDLAVVKVNAPASELHPLTLGDSSTLQVGQTVVAIGSPFGFVGSMTKGIISGLGRTLDSEHLAPGGTQPFTAGDLIQTDAAVNIGNSGGPLFNLNGEVVGVNRAIQTVNFNSAGQPLNSGIAFAVSSNIVKRVMPSLISNGKYDYPYLGISSNSLGNSSYSALSRFSTLTLDEIQALGLTQTTGAYISQVTPGGPADLAGIKGADPNKPTSIQGLYAGGDLITAVDGHQIIQFDDLLAYLIDNKSPGDKVVLTVIRNGQKMDITVTLGKRPS